MSYSCNDIKKRIKELEERINILKLRLAEQKQLLENEKIRNKIYYSKKRKEASLWLENERINLISDCIKENGDGMTIREISKKTGLNYLIVYKIVTDNQNIFYSYYSGVRGKPKVIYLKENFLNQT